MTKSVVGTQMKVVLTRPSAHISHLSRRWCPGKPQRWRLRNNQNQEWTKKKSARFLMPEKMHDVLFPIFTFTVRLVHPEMDV